MAGHANPPAARAGEPSTSNNSNATKRKFLQAACKRLPGKLYRSPGSGTGSGFTPALLIDKVHDVYEHFADQIQHVVDGQDANQCLVNVDNG